MNAISGKRPEISIVMASFNSAKYLHDAIGSVISQDFPDWELRIVDDASTDESQLVVDRYLSDDRIHIHRHDKNRGYAAAQMTGFAVSLGDVIVVLDSDDVLQPNALSIVAKAHKERPEVAIILSEMILSDEDLNPLTTSATTPEHRKDPLLWFRSVTHLRTFKKDYYEKTVGLDPKYRISSDLDLMFKLEEVGGVLRLYVPLIRYRIHRSSLSNDPQKYASAMTDAALVMLDAYRRRLRRSCAPNLHPSALASWLLLGAQSNFDAGRSLKACLMWFRSISVAPLENSSYSFFLRMIHPKRWLIRDRTIYFHVLRMQNATGGRYPGYIQCVPFVHPPGHAIFGGDYVPDCAGECVVEFDLRYRGFGNGSECRVVTIDAYENALTNLVLVTRELSSSELNRENPTLSFSVAIGMRVEFRVYWHGVGTLEIFGVRVQPPQ